ncbi:GNAT family N-acetyltransferase [Chelativorans salis]|uniref:GNAT family N-acetyltransferase n=1 Tax=Chelativorans salis TaxID=2978478 RepID=A0ABT2LP96_9HYPH|nr:GNAT family N-acetyltransferase [Chelativorans sp. EGI FJ00035]MCT7376385.1 GNAT family N-acetyltransferase [Chelativorans sp. EGI FJ00035]
MTREIVLRPGRRADADEIARVMRAALSSFNWMPMVHTPEEDRAFIGNHVLRHQKVTIAEAEGEIVGFIAVEGEWVEQLYLKPGWTGRSVGSRLLDHATAVMPVVKLHCFQANSGARRFYERHGFVAEVFGDGSGNEEKLPDIRYVRYRAER